MFIEAHQHELSSNNSIDLVFVASKNIKVFPSGRRRSTKIDTDNSTSTETDKIYIPFDPEARLNTENNNVCGSSVNGFTNSYIKSWEEHKLSLFVDGYLFIIELPSANSNPNSFVSGIVSTINSIKDKNNQISIDDLNSIYVNIILEDTPLYVNKSGLNYDTKVLRNQSDTTYSLDCLDLIDTTKFSDTDNINNYYFSGLSFSSIPVTNRTIDSTDTDAIVSYRENPKTPTFTRSQRIVSLRILDNVDGEWKICQRALLPKIKHGETEDSVVIDKLTLTTDLERQYITKDSDGNITDIKTRKVPTMALVDNQLRFFNVNSI